MIHFTDSGGTGVPVLLVHAIGCDHRMWDGLGTALSPRFRVIRMDVRGMAEAPSRRVPIPWTSSPTTRATSLDSLKIDKAHWVGLSMGGMIGQAFALRHPQRLRKLVLANTTSTYGTQGPEMWEARAKASAKAAWRR
jgi:3-oxoadipate enol-lactonase